MQSARLEGVGGKQRSDFCLPYVLERVEEPRPHLLTRALLMFVEIEQGYGNISHVYPTVTVYVRIRVPSRHATE
jgi:hypothetical protein